MYIYMRVCMCVFLYIRIFIGIISVKLYLVITT